MAELRGLVGQSLTGRKAVPVLAYAAVYSAGSYTFVAPVSGVFKFIACGSGSGGNGFDRGGSSGAYVEKTRRLAVGEAVGIVVAKAVNLGANSAGNDTIFVFSDGLVVVAGGGAAISGTGLGGVASNGDVNINGSASSPSFTSGNPGSGLGGGPGGGTDGSTISGGSGAPGVAPFFGGAGGGVGLLIPGVGGGGAGIAGGVQGSSAPGSAVVVQIQS